MEKSGAGVPGRGSSGGVPAEGGSDREGSGGGGPAEGGRAEDGLGERLSGAPINKRNHHAQTSEKRPQQPNL